MVGDTSRPPSSTESPNTVIGPSGPGVLMTSSSGAAVAGDAGESTTRGRGHDEREQGGAEPSARAGGRGRPREDGGHGGEPDQRWSGPYTAGSHGRPVDDRLPAGARRRAGVGGGGRAAVPCRGRRLRRWLPGCVGVLHPLRVPDHQPAGARARPPFVDRARHVLRAPHPSSAAGERALPGDDRRDRHGDRRVRRRRRPAAPDRRLDPAGGELGVPRRRGFVPADLPADRRHPLAARALLVARDRGAVLLGVAADDGGGARRRALRGAAGRSWSPR